MTPATPLKPMPLTAFTKPLESHVLAPTGTILEVVQTPEDLEFYIGNLLTIYGARHAMKVSYTLSEFHQTSSLYSFFDLVKLATNFGMAYTITAIGIALGRALDDELATLELLYPTQTYAYQDIPSLSEVKLVSYNGQADGLGEILEWFDYDNIHLPGAVNDFSYLLNWVGKQEPLYSAFFPTPFSPITFTIEFLHLTCKFPVTPELTAYLKKLYNA
jgi:hypothetical protein